jgi:hypothetical protein
MLTLASVVYGFVVWSTREGGRRTDLRESKRVLISGPPTPIAASVVGVLR